MPYTPQTPADIREMLDAIGAAGLDDLFQEIPAPIRKPRITIPDPLTEPELRAEVARLTAGHATTEDCLSFLGGGAYERIRPSLVDRLLSRSEFSTSYTPYQAEVSQGTLQYIFEFQSLIAGLTGMEVANASMYDGASALAEAALMALRITRKRRVLFAATLHPRWKSTLRTYLSGMPTELIEIPEHEGSLDLAALGDLLSADTAAVLVQHPNFFGYLEDQEKLGSLLEGGETIWVQASDPVSLGLLAPPGAFDVDIAVGELQSLGLPLSFGGPYAGYFACKQKYVRQMPGRLVGKTVDAAGHTGYVLTLQTREQHIRREKATSNICTNQSLCALAATIYLSLMGPEGLREVAQRNSDLAHAFATRLAAIPGVKQISARPFFNEFTLELKVPASRLAQALKEEGILAGIHDPLWTGKANRLIVCVTETKKKADLDRAAGAFEKALKP
jgi:glycine dehydrogenase subunit 1